MKYTAYIYTVPQSIVIEARTKQSAYNKAKKYVSKLGLVNVSKIEIKSKSPNREVLQIDEQGNVIAEWPSLAKASIGVGLHKMSISKCIHGYIKHAGGFYWKYK